MDAELVTQIILNLYKSSLIYSTVYINDVQIDFDDFSIYDDFLFLDFNDHHIVSIHFNDIYKIS